MRKLLDKLNLYILLKRFYKNPLFVKMYKMIVFAKDKEGKYIKDEEGKKIIEALREATIDLEKAGKFIKYLELVITMELKNMTWVNDYDTLKRKMKLQVYLKLKQEIERSMGINNKNYEKTTETINGEED